jgi:hypothetical protein
LEREERGERKGRVMMGGCRSMVGKGREFVPYGGSSESHTSEKTSHEKFMMMIRRFLFEKKVIRRVSIVIGKNAVSR